MKKTLGAILFVSAGFAAAVFVFTNHASAASSGEALFKQHCAVCHPDGGNIINPQKTLHKKDRDVNNIKIADDILHLMRNPGLGMTKFDEKTIADKDAKEIAEYVLKTFK